MLRHIVMWKFREGEEENREKFLSGRSYFYKHKPAPADKHGKDLSQQAFNIGTTEL